MVLAARRWSALTRSGATPSTVAAVVRWMSSPPRKASIIAGSCAMWASTRSSIWL